MKFIDRMVADSRQVALNHTAGLSLPQQMQMSLFASFALLDKENKYKLKMMEIIEKRLHALWDNTGFTLIKDPLRVGYYTEIDMLVWAKKFGGFDGPEWSIRASLANLNEKDYVVIGQGIKRILDEYAKAWKKTTEK